MSTAAAASSAAAGVSARADAFVSQLCSTLVSQLGASSFAHSASSLTAHLQATFRALPQQRATHGKIGQMREYLLRPEQMEKYVQKVALAIEQAAGRKGQASTAATAASSSAATAASAALFSTSDYLAALSAIDGQVAADPSSVEVASAYARLLLPPNAPTIVSQHLMRTLARQAQAAAAAAHHGKHGHKAAAGTAHSGASFLSSSLPLLLLPFHTSPGASSPAALLRHLTSLVALLTGDQLPHAALHGSSASGVLSALVARVATAFAALRLTPAQVRVYQDRMARLLLVEAKAYPAAHWAAEGAQEATQRFISRARLALRRAGGGGGSGSFSGSLAGELMLLQHALDGLVAYKAAEKATTTTGGGKSAAKSAVVVDFHDCAFFHAATFLGVFHACLVDLLGQLATGARLASEGEEAVWVRVAILARGVANNTHGLPATYHATLRATTTDLLARLPRLPLPLLLRPTIQERAPQVQSVQGLWQPTAAAANGGAQNQQQQYALKLNTLERILEDLDGDLTIQEEALTAAANEEGQEEEEADTDMEDSAAAPSIKVESAAVTTTKVGKKGSKKSAAAGPHASGAAAGDSFSAFGSAHASLFFVDSVGSGAGAGAGALAAAGAEGGDSTAGASDADALEELTVGRSMTKILAGMTPSTEIIRAAAVPATTHEEEAEHQAQVDREREAQAKKKRDAKTKEKAKDKAKMAAKKKRKAEEDAEAEAEVDVDVEAEEQPQEAADEDMATGEEETAATAAAAEPSPMDEAEEEEAAEEAPKSKKQAATGKAKKVAPKKDESTAAAAEKEEPKATRSKRAKK